MIIRFRKPFFGIFLIKIAYPFIGMPIATGDRFTGDDPNLSVSSSKTSFHLLEDEIIHFLKKRPCDGVKPRVRGQPVGAENPRHAPFLTDNEGMTKQKNRHFLERGKEVETNRWLCLLLFILHGVS
ncbi:hypothetical protein CEXT_326411 [Caerostris extrusa]|uniref:Uncharacterized protein n=1 Tax=Caerostris extrusa TaxID=172846 RepID=A0AAV4WFP5_CAEEX|nr:hypothetical protein CEXT_326411 [Caerostris extrusa]